MVECGVVAGHPGDGRDASASGTGASVACEAFDDTVHPVDETRLPLEDPHQRLLRNRIRQQRRRLGTSLLLAAAAGAGVGLLAAGVYAIVEGDPVREEPVRIDRVEVSVPVAAPTDDEQTSPGTPAGTSVPAEGGAAEDPMVRCIEDSMRDVNLDDGPEREQAVIDAQLECAAQLFGSG